VAGFIVIIVWVVLAFVLASAARDKGRSYWIFFLISLFLSPLTGFILLSICNIKKSLEINKIINGKAKTCPFCASVLKIEATICKHCGRDVRPEQFEDDSDNFEEDDDEEEEEVDENLKNSLDVIFAAAGNTNEYDEYESDYYEEEKNDDDDRYSRNNRERDIKEERKKSSELKERSISNDNRKLTTVQNYYCKWCGVKNTSVTGLINSSGCTLSPTKKHELYEGSEKSQYVCKYCGVKNSSIKGLLLSSGCIKSPTKRHIPSL
jgi:hypothetical protein